MMNNSSSRGARRIVSASSASAHNRSEANGERPASSHQSGRDQQQRVRAEERKQTDGGDLFPDIHSNNLSQNQSR